MAKSRIYTVESVDGKTQRLVRATRNGPALTHVAQSLFRVRPSTQNDLESLLPKGARIEEAGEAVQEEERQG